MTSAWTGFHGALVLVLVVAPLEWVGVFHAFGLYRVEHLSAWEEFRGIISATTVGVGVIMVSTFWWEASLTRPFLAWTWLFAIGFELVTRRSFRWWIRQLKRDGTLTLRTLLVGTNDEVARLARVLQPSVRGFAADRMRVDVRRSRMLTLGFLAWANSMSWRRSSAESASSACSWRRPRCRPKT